MDNDKMAPQSSLFQVFLRLRPAQTIKQNNEQWLLVESPNTASAETDETTETKPSFSTHITLQPPNDSRKRAIERFGFTKIFQEEATQANVFQETGTAECAKSLLLNGRDGLIATLGVTGSGKSHTILGTKTHRGLTQMTLDVLFRSIGSKIRKLQDPDLPIEATFISQLQACDHSEAQMMSATSFLDMVYSDGDRARTSRAQTPMTGYNSRAQTPMMVRQTLELPGSFPLSPCAKSRLSQAVVPDTRKIPNMIARDQALRAHHAEASRTSIQNSMPFHATKSPRSAALKHPFTPFWQRLCSKKPYAKSRHEQESMPHHTRKPPMPHPSTFAQLPDVSRFAIEVDQNFDYAVIVSMYEVYNDRIFDLLSSTNMAGGPAAGTRGNALIKGLTRRPLLFKNTEMSSDRKVVAGLRKIVCSSYDEAMMVLETGLTERRVAGTGSNSVSSRSHGFFCIEVKKSQRSRYYASNDWTGGTLSVVDLAGSERARNAKTTGSTLAEAGKINESLMYLGQCLQVQSDCQQDGSKPIVPFRQCKLTELLFSNSFPSASQSHSVTRQPQRAIMIVTADPQGDFNATSQILRYSALAREVTVPRIPSITSVMINAGQRNTGSRNNPNDQFFSAQELEQATNEVKRLAEECEALAVRVTEEEIRRTEAEFRLQAMEEKMVVSEQEIREECWNEMELMMDEERERWRTAWEKERVKNEDFLDGKIDILEKTSHIKIHSDVDNDTRVDELERENEVLRAKLQALEQDMQTRSPTKKSRNTTAAPKTPASKGLNALQEVSNTNIMTNPFLSALKARDSGSAMKVKRTDDGTMMIENSQNASPRKLSLRNSTVIKSNGPDELADDGYAEAPGTVVKKKQRKLTTRKWDLGDPDEI